MFEISQNYERIYANIIRFNRQYLQANTGLKTLVIGVSGGIDSALTCALAYETLKNVPKVRQIGRSIAIESNTQNEIARAEAIGQAFCDTYEEIDLTVPFHNLYKDLVAPERFRDDVSYDEKIRKGNLKARMRMCYLFDLAHFENGMVLSTDNYTEFLLGFWTLHGDVGNFGMLQFLWKTEVYGLAGYLADKYKTEGRPELSDALQACIDAIPTDGLGITSSDFEQIGVSDYAEADRILIDYLLNGKSELAIQPIVEKHLKTGFKRSDPNNIAREIILGVS
jgi:NAD+ synthetase